VLNHPDSEIDGKAVRTNGKVVRVALTPLSSTIMLSARKGIIKKSSEHCLARLYDPP
jgi:hypothetical protein